MLCHCKDRHPETGPNFRTVVRDLLFRKCKCAPPKMAARIFYLSADVCCQSASGSGRIWNLTSLLVVPLPPSMWKGARVEIVDTAVESLCVIAHRVRHAQRQELAVHQREHAFGEIAGRDRRVFAQAERVIYIDEVVIRRFGTAIFHRALVVRAGESVQRPAFGAVLSGS